MATKSGSQPPKTKRGGGSGGNGRGPADRFRYGWRYVTKRFANGRTEMREIPLTLEDVLHPQEGDVIPQHPRHAKECRYLTGVCETRGGRRRGFRVFEDCLIDFAIAGLRPLAPDVAAFDRLRSEPDVTEGTFSVAQHGGRCLLAVEDVSPDTRENDVTRKVPLYHRAGIGVYVIVDWQGALHPRELIGYRWQPQGYARMRLDNEGRLRIKELGIRLGLEDEWLVCYDDATGAKLGDYAQVTRDLEAAEQARAAAEQARAAAEQERAAAEQAQAAAEQERDAAQQERNAAQQWAAAAEERIRHLEQELQRRSQGPGTS